MLQELHSHWQLPLKNTEIISAIQTGISNGALKPNIGKSYKLSEAPQSHTDIITPPPGTGATGKIVIHPWDL